MKRIVLLAVVSLAVPAHAASSGAGQPYAGLERRELKALSAEQIDGLLQGKGMSLALSAELNGLPGPRHVLDLANELALDEGQKARITEIFGRMERDAQSLGAEIVAAETVLDETFASGQASAERVAALTAEIGVLQGRLRAIHLVAHLETDPLLTKHQKHFYAAKRGYGGTTLNGHNAGHKH